VADAEARPEPADDEDAEPKSGSAPAKPDEAKTQDGEKEERRLKNAPLTAALLATNIGVFAAQVWLGGGLRFLLGGTSDSDRVIWTRILHLLGANDSTFTIADNRFETLVTSCFLHGSLIHLGMNLLVLWQVGPFLERAIGRARFLPLYLGAGVIASACSAIAGRFLGPAPSVGASGAICGLIGAMLVLGGRTQGWKGPLARQMGGWLAFLLLVGFFQRYQQGIAQIDNAAHIGGALGGVMIAATWRRGFTYSQRAQTAIIAGCIGLVMASGVTVWVRNRTDPYIFMSIGERVAYARRAAHIGQCDRAYAALTRARQMDPDNPGLRDHGLDIDRLCLSQSSSTMPNVNGR